MKSILAGLTAALAITASAQAQIQITEWMYQGANGEFIEFTNLGVSAIDLTGWSFDDDDDVPGAFDLTGFGMIAVGESVILTEATAAAFRTAWGLGTSVKVLGGLDHNLARNDRINLFDNTNSLVDVLTYGDQNFPGTIRTQNVSGWTTVTNLGTNNVGTWVFSTVGDAQGSFMSVGGDIGNPGSYSAIPEPGTYAACLGLVALAFAAFRRRQRRLALKTN